MKARCVKCNNMWEISVRQKIQKGGYICPNCQQGLKVKTIRVRHVEDGRM